ncbi:cytidylyltransferase domain-containing protein [Synechococcus sp. MIT S9504]|uniref:acylneuraminate cytidylyltransferase family protein n=1 Tax=Synechococcus sp. MIT S9504 TaxID=1801628 RepID=UPI0007BBCD46|nr:acylneuraminate cytidylyltransferase family protein [Synechococcus sp. MIT S9504]KZR85006.1 N-acylneuraminate cytidylyltransferase [Synechococcus sp. MIT S9504]
MSLVALIPARGGSKGIPRKNIRPFYGKPLLQWSIDVALAAPSVDRVVVSTDDHEIAEIALAGGAEVPFLRPLELATDTASGIAPVLHVLEQLPDVSDLLLLQPTSPLRRVEDVEKIVALYRQAGNDSVVSVSLSSKHPAWMFSMSPDKVLQPLLYRSNVACRQQLPHAYELNGALYLASRCFLERESSFLNKQTLGYVMSPEHSVDIDTLLDWQWGEFLMQQTG